METPVQCPNLGFNHASLSTTNLGSHEDPGSTLPRLHPSQCQPPQPQAHGDSGTSPDLGLQTCPSFNHHTTSETQTETQVQSQLLGSNHASHSSTTSGPHGDPGSTPTPDSIHVPVSTATTSNSHGDPVQSQLLAQTMPQFQAPLRAYMETQCSTPTLIPIHVPGVNHHNLRLTWRPRSNTCA